MEEVSQMLEANTADKYVTFDYEAQHFGFNPITFINGMYNAVCDLYRDALLAFFTKLSEKYPGVVPEEKVTEARHTVGRMIDQQINYTFDKLELILLKKVFTIPDECVLPNDKCQIACKSKEEAGALQNKKIELRKRIIALKYANAVLTKQLEHGEVFSERLKKNLETLKSFSEISGGHNMKDWLSYLSDSILTAFKNTRG